MGNSLLISLFLFVSAITTTETQLLFDTQQSCPAPDSTLNYRPVIGIVSHPGDGATGRLSNATNVSYIAASYVKFAEMAGATVIPLLYTEPSQILNQDNNILEEFSAASQASTVQLVENVNIEGTVFGRFPPVLLKKMGTDCLVMQNHHFGISPERFQANRHLSSFFRVLTTSTDENNKVYVSTVQAKRYPITAFQWHPEKNVFEWGSSRIPHTEDAIQVTTHVANYFISEARKSSNKPVAREVLDKLIYNYNPTYGGKAGKGYDEVYLFTPHSALEFSVEKKEQCN
ncbi:gamma-glutamyl hydrolase 2-like isoform X2 [Lycium ferocissimum]|uniref:gamma-glutamyl hydrolase 2-like isoform X2 n=1 Tax=Lycium ferocissimum TaxID=112874 RepID=UPI002815576E|nr:gamma-glutamyl hydrolase 2-like isoform X2 [Lycium ferocissimum]